MGQSVNKRPGGGKAHPDWSTFHATAGPDVFWRFCDFGRRNAAGMDEITTFVELRGGAVEAHYHLMGKTNLDAERGQMMMIRSVIRLVRESGFTLLDLAVGMMLLGFAVLVAQPVFSAVTRAPEAGAVHTITFAPNGTVLGAGAITFSDVEGNSRLIVVGEDGSIGIR